MTPQELIDAWRKEARKHEQAMADGDCESFSDEYWLHLEVARTYRQCLGQLEAALNASSTLSSHHHSGE